MDSQMGRHHLMDSEISESNGSSSFFSLCYKHPYKGIISYDCIGYKNIRSVFRNIVIFLPENYKNKHTFYNDFVTNFNIFLI